MQYVFLIRSSAGCKKNHEAQPIDVVLTAGVRAYQKHVLHEQEVVSIFIANLNVIFKDILRKILTIFYACNSLYCRCSPDVHCVPKNVTTFLMIS